MNEFSLPLAWLLPGAFLFSAGLIALLMRPARALGWADHPCTRKQHRHPVPLVGGAAMCATCVLGVLLLPVKPEHWPVLLTCATLVTWIGLVDDLRHTRPATRFFFEGLVILLMVWGGQTMVVDLGDLFGLGPVVLGGWTVPFTVFAVIGVINALNMIDGLDGLAGGTGLVAAGWLLVLCLTAPGSRPDTIGALLVLVMAIAGFLVFNLRTPWRARASVFMGDAGSTLLGFVLSWFLIALSQGDRAVMAPITAVWILALPLLDTLSVMFRRILAGTNPFAADRQHLHYLLLGRGLGDGQVTALLLVFSAVAGGVGVLADRLAVPHPVMFYAFCLLLLAHFALTTVLIRRRPTTPGRGADRCGSSRGNATCKPVPLDSVLDAATARDGIGGGGQ